MEAEATKAAGRCSDARHFRNRKAREPLEHAPNLRPFYRDRGITIADLRAELASDAPFAGLARDEQPYGNGLDPSLY